MKKFLSVLLMIVMAMSITVAAVGCRNEYSETFIGAISQESYETDKGAVEAFLEIELSGAAATAELVDFEKKSTLSEKEIGELKTEGALEEGDTIVSVDVVDVSYKKKEDVSSTASSDEDVSVFTIYIIVISPQGVTEYEYRYYVPKAVEGDALTRSYFEDVLDPSKYENCTQEYSSKSQTKTGGMTVNIDQTYTIKTTKEAASIALHVIDPRSIGSVTYMDVFGFFGYDEDHNFKVWLSTDNGATYISAPSNAFAQYGVTNMESFVKMCLPKLDYSYYEKTDYGFKIQDSFIGKYVKMALSSIGVDADVEAELQFYVKEGRIVRMASNLSASYSGINTTVNEEVVFSEFGTTTVTKPQAID